MYFWVAFNLVCFVWAELCIMDNTNVRDQEQTPKEGWTGLLSSQMPKQGPLKPSALSMALHGSPAYKLPIYLCTHVLWLVLGFVGRFGNCWIKVLASCQHTITVIIGTKDSQHSVSKCLTSGIVYLQTPNREKRTMLDLAASSLTSNLQIATN